MYQDYPIVHETMIIDMFWVWTIIIILISILVITLLGLSKMFKKASVNSVYAFIPFYNLYKLLEICGISKIHMLLFFIPIFNIYTYVKIAYELKDYYNKETSFMFLILFLPFVALPILGFSKDKYVGINNKKVEGISIQELDKKEVLEEKEVEVVKRDTSIGMGTSVKTNVDNSDDSLLKVDLNVLNKNKVDNEVIECPKCHNKMKKSAGVCFFCGYKVNS